MVKNVERVVVVRCRLLLLSSARARCATTFIIFNGSAHAIAAIKATGCCYYTHHNYRRCTSKKKKKLRMNAVVCFLYLA